MAKSITRGRVAAVAGGAALLLGTVVLPAGAETHDVTYALDNGVITVGANEYELPAATGISGTWDDVTGDFEGTFTSAPVDTTSELTAPVVGTIFLSYEFIGAGPVTGNIDPATGIGGASSLVDVEIRVDRLETGGDPVILDTICTIAGVTVDYDIEATGAIPESTLFNSLSLTASGFNVPEPTCVLGPEGNEQLLPILQGAIGEQLGVPTSDTSAEIVLSLGDIPEPPPTTTRPPAPSTTAPQTTCDSIGRTNIPSGDPDYAPHLDADGDGVACEAAEAAPARPVAASPRYTG